MTKTLSNLGLSLLLAVLVWVAAVQQENQFQTQDYDRDIELVVIPAQPEFVITEANIPDRIKLQRVRAPVDRWASLDPSKFRATFDLSGLEAGLHEIPINLETSHPEVTVPEFTPREITVNLETLETMTKTITINVFDTPPLGYSQGQETVTPTLVTLEGASSLVNQVEHVVANLSVRDARETQQDVRSLLILNRDRNVLKGLTVTPNQVEVTVPIEQDFSYKDVSVSSIIQGNVRRGYWISNIETEPSNITLFGKPNVLEALPGFIDTTPINIEDATESFSVNVPLALPNGVTIVAPAELVGVKVKIDISVTESSKTIIRPVAQQGISDGYEWEASPTAVDVLVSGPIPRLEALDPSTIEVRVDLFELEPGTHKVKPNIFAPDDIQAKVVLDTIEVTVWSNEPTATPTLIPTQTATPQPTRTVRPGGATPSSAFNISSPIPTPATLTPTKETNE